MQQKQENPTEHLLMKAQTDMAGMAKILASAMPWTTENQWIAAMSSGSYEGVFNQQQQELIRKFYKHHEPRLHQAYGAMSMM